MENNPMCISVRAISGMPFLLILAVSAVMPLSGKSDGPKQSNENEREAKGKDQIVTVLYEGPLVHEQNWTIKAGPAGPNNQKFRDLGGTCSMIPADVRNGAGSGFERVTFEAERQDLGLWKMAWTDTVSGAATDGNNYTYRQRLEFTAPTNDGKAPRPNRATPSPGNEGFLQIVPSHVNADSLDLIDLFMLESPGAGVVANSHVHWTWRLQIPPADMDPPPAFFPFLLQGKYVLHKHDQLAGQLGCDPL